MKGALEHLLNTVVDSTVASCGATGCSEKLAEDVLHVATVLETVTEGIDEVGARLVPAARLLLAIRIEQALGKFEGSDDF